MIASVGPTNLTVGDPVTVHVQISGSGVLDGVSLPLPDAWNNFKTFPPTSKTDTTDPYGFQGTKTFEQIISPQNADVHVLPPISFSFFNPDDGHYHYLDRRPPCRSRSSPPGPRPCPLSWRTRANPPLRKSQPPQDILPIRENLGTLDSLGVPLVARPAFLALQSLPVIAFFATLVWRKRASTAWRITRACAAVAPLPSSSAAA